MNNKIIVQSNIEVSKNVKKQIEEIENNTNYHFLIPRINEFFKFVSECPTNLFGARQRGYQVEKLNSKKGTTVFSIRITGGDRFTYSVDKNGNVTILGILGHYKGTNYESYVSPKFEPLFDSALSFFKGETTFFQLIEEFGEEIEIMPFVEENNKNKLMKLKEKIICKNITMDDIDGLEFILKDNDDHLYFSKNDLLELEKSNKEKNENNTNHL